MEFNLNTMNNVIFVGYRRRVLNLRIQGIIELQHIRGSISAKLTMRMIIIVVVKTSPQFKIIRKSSNNSSSVGFCSSSTIGSSSRLIALASKNNGKLWKKERKTIGNEESDIIVKNSYTTSDS